MIHNEYRVTHIEGMDVYTYRSGDRFGWRATIDGEKHGRSCSAYQALYLFPVGGPFLLEHINNVLVLAARQEQYLIKKNKHDTKHCICFEHEQSH